MLRYMSWSKIKKYLPLLLLIYLPPIIIIVIVGSIAELKDIPVGNFITDPSQVVGFDSYIGLLNNLGVVLWASTMAICIFTFLTLRRRAGNEDISKFVLFSGIFTLILLLDDLFVIHELSRANEFALPGIYILIFITLLYRFRKTILETEYVFLIFALCLFGISLLIDFIQSLYSGFLTGGLRSMLEESCKFLGIVSWLAYFTRICLSSIRNKIVS